MPIALLRDPVGGRVVGVYQSGPPLINGSLAHQRSQLSRMYDFRAARAEADRRDAISTASQVANETGAINAPQGSIRLELWREDLLKHNGSVRSLGGGIRRRRRTRCVSKSRCFPLLAEAFLESPIGTRAWTAS